MIRIWKGLEMEGPSIGIATMFVCSDVQVDPSLIYQLLRDNPEIRRIYFGAGRKSFVGTEDWAGLYHSLVALHGITNVTIEAHETELLDFISKYDAPLVSFVRTWYDFPSVYGQVYFKTDDTKKVTIHTGTTSTWLDTLGNDNLFASDVLLYEED